jgi:hypothetical protein
MKIIEKLALLIATIFSTVDIVNAETAPHNYSSYHTNFFANMTNPWSFVSNFDNFWTNVVPPEMFWGVLLVVPFATLYNRTGSAIIPAVIYLFIGGAMAAIMPPQLGQFYYWFLLVGAGGIMFELFVGSQG